MGFSGVIGGILVAFLPETKDLHMPDTVEEIEDRAKATMNKKNKKSSKHPTNKNANTESFCNHMINDIIL